MALAVVHERGFASFFGRADAPGDFKAEQLAVDIRRAVAPEPVVFMIPYAASPVKHREQIVAVAVDDFAADFHKSARGHAVDFFGKEEVICVLFKRIHNDDALARVVVRPEVALDFRALPVKVTFFLGNLEP